MIKKSILFQVEIRTYLLTVTVYTVGTLLRNLYFWSNFTFAIESLKLFTICTRSMHFANSSLMRFSGVIFSAIVDYPPELFFSISTLTDFEILTNNYNLL